MRAACLNSAENRQSLTIEAEGLSAAMVHQMAVMVHIHTAKLHPHDANLHVASLSSLAANL
jgi:hypothetical protein